MVHKLGCLSQALGDLFGNKSKRGFFLMQVPSHQLIKSPGGGAEKSAFLKNAQVTQ